MAVVTRTSARLLVLLLAVLALLAAQSWNAGPARAANGAPVYDSIPAVPPSSYPSVGYQATQTAEFGDLVELAGTDRDLEYLTVGLVSWACETGGGATCVTTPGSTFSHPITVNIYEEGTAPAPGALLATLTKTVDVPYRPSAAPAQVCPSNTQWYDPVTTTCQNGFLFLEDFDFASQVVDLPDRVIVTVAFNTNTWGYAPLNANGPYESLNVAVISSTPTVGTDLDTATMYHAGGAAPVLEAEGGYTSYGLALRIIATDLLGTLPDPGTGGNTGGNTGGGSSTGELPTLAVTGSEPSPITGLVGLAVILVGIVFVAVAPRRAGAHRA